MTLAGLRKAVVDSHIAGIAVAIMLFQLIESAFVVALPFLNHIVYGVFRNVEMRQDPFFHPPLDTAPDYALLMGQVLGLVCGACLVLVAAWGLCRWAYGAGPLTSLARLHSRLSNAIPEKPDA